MPDITMCRPTQKCKLKNSCWRHTAQASDYQSMADFSDKLDDFVCEFYYSDVGKHKGRRDERTN
jgi:hypothetical protein